MKKVRLDTRVDLVVELEKVKPRTTGIQSIIDEARAGEFHDYKNQKYDCGKTELVKRLQLNGLYSLSMRVANGDFDEDADEDDKAEMRKRLPRKMWGPLGLEQEKTFVPAANVDGFFPRIRGKAFQKGTAWTWEAYITIGESEPIIITSPDTFMNELAAVNNMKINAAKISSLACEALVAEKPTHFMDLKHGRHIEINVFARPEKPGGAT